MVRIAFSDMDGTFLTPEKTVTPENARMLDAAFERGVQFVPCSGRNVGDLPREVVSHPSVRYAICCNGALIVDTSTQEVLRKVLIEKDLVRDLYERVRDMRVTFDVFADGRVYPHRDRFPIIDEVDLSKVSLFLINEVEGEQVAGASTEPGRILDAMAERFPHAATVLTLGPDGSIYQAPGGGERIFQRAYEVEAVDTTGAGDTFTGYFVAARSAGRPVAEALDLAARASALAVTRAGAVPSIPTIDEVLLARL